MKILIKVFWAFLGLMGMFLSLFVIGVFLKVALLIFMVGWEFLNLLK